MACGGRLVRLDCTYYDLKLSGENASHRTDERPFITGLDRKTDRRFSSIRSATDEAQRWVPPVLDRNRLYHCDCGGLRPSTATMISAARCACDLRHVPGLEKGLSRVRGWRAADVRLPAMGALALEYNARYGTSMSRVDEYATRYSELGDVKQLSGTLPL